MSAQIATFTFENKQVRVVEFNGQRVFLVRDVALAIEASDLKTSIARWQRSGELGERHVIKMAGQEAVDIARLLVSDESSPTNKDAINRAAGGILLVTERGVMRVAMLAKTEPSRRFRDWVEDVLEEIGRTGSYSRDANGFEAKVPQSFAQALRLAADLQEQVEQQQAIIEAQQPAVEFVERYVEAKSATSIRDAAKVLGIREKQFIAKMLEDGVLYRRADRVLMPYAEHLHADRFEVKTILVGEKAREQTRITPMGLEWLARRYGVRVEAGAVPC